MVGVGQMNDEEAAFVLCVSAQATFLEVEDAYRQKVWDLQAAGGQKSLAEWEVQTQAVVDVPLNGKDYCISPA